MANGILFSARLVTVLILLAFSKSHCATLIQWCRLLVYLALYGGQARHTINLYVVHFRINYFLAKHWISPFLPPKATHIFIWWPNGEAI